MIVEPTVEWNEQTGDVTIKTWPGVNVAADLGEIAIQQGADFTLNITHLDGTLAPVDYSSGYTASLVIEQQHDSSTAIATLTQADGITLGSGANNIVIARTAAQIALWSTFVRTIWRLVTVRTTGTVTTRLAEGTVVLRRA